MRSIITQTKNITHHKKYKDTSQEYNKLITKP